LFLTHCLLFSVNRVAVEHYFELSDAQVPSPSTEPRRLQASFGGAQSAPANKKIGRKCDLATALLPKGDTRATNACTEYHNGRVLQMISFEVAVNRMVRRLTPSSSLSSAQTVGAEKRFNVAAEPIDIRE
jgi:hypothetical protein